MPHLRPLAAALVAALSAVACGDELDRSSELRTLRVLAVQVDTPFAPPGSTPQLAMELVDASPSAMKSGSPRPVQVVWLGGCNNPEGDAHGACKDALRSAAARLTNEDLSAEQVPAGAENVIGFGKNFAYKIQENLIEQHATVSTALLPFGLTFVYFAACGGELQRAPEGDDFPLRCVDPTTKQALGVEDFVTGYTQIWSYRDLRNHNPIIEERRLLEASSSRSACATDASCPAGEACGSEGVCLRVIARCEDDGADSCPAIRIAPRIDERSTERAESASVLGDDAPLENLWVAYFTRHGSFESEARFAHDGSLGWADYHTSWFAPRDPGENRLWAVVRDNRGGVAWTFEDVIVR